MPYCVMADVIAWQMLYALLKLWQMLLPIGRCYPIFISGRCYCLINNLTFSIPYSALIC